MALTVLSIATVLPNIGGGLWRSSVSNPAFFTAGLYKRYVRPGDTMLLLPYASYGESMLWQGETQMYFRMVEGLGPQLPKSYSADLATTPLFAPDPGKFFVGAHATQALARLAVFLRRHDVREVVVDKGQPGPWPGVMARLKLVPVDVGGALVYTLPPHV